MIDIHCHILAALDDGPRRLEISLEMAAIAAEDGIKTIIATPHADGLTVNPGSVETAVLNLQEKLHGRKIALRIAAGFEIPYHLVLELAESHTLAGSRYVLFELPHFQVPPDAPQTIYRLLEQGLWPIIAHPERNSTLIDQPDLLTGLIEAGALVQLTAASITGALGPDVQRCAHYLLNRRQAHFIATDSHSPTFRTPVLRSARKIAARLLNSELAAALVEDNPARILQNTGQPN